MHTHLTPESDHLRSRQVAAHDSATPAHSLAPPSLQLKADGSLQRMDMEEEEELMMKRAPVQRMDMEEEEELMMKRAPVQLMDMEEEEELMMKRAPVQRMDMEEEEELMMKRAPVQRMDMEEEEELMMKRAPVQRKSRSTPYQLKLDHDTQAHMEGTLGADFSDVRIHAESDHATEVGALAYTQGSDIHFAPGQYQPDTASGRELIGHELTHVVQQREGRVQPTGTVAGQPLNDSASLEREADEMGAKAARGR